jgi:creatinine amidohydrolase
MNSNLAGLARFSRFARLPLIFLLFVFVAPASYSQQKLSPNWEELTADDFVKAIGQANGTCVLPIGILEKHGPHLPLGTDLIRIRFVAANAAQLEYAVVFPAYYFGQISEARHVPGTMAYRPETQMALLQETTDEMSRNGCKKIIIANGHGGNEEFLPYFAQTQMAVPHDYVVYVFAMPDLQVAGRPEVKSPKDMHAGEAETSHIMAARPDLVHLDRLGQESGADQHRQKLPDTLFTGIWWYARFPNHYAGDAAAANKELGEFDVNTWARLLADAIRAVKADNESLKLQNEFYEQSKHPLDTKSN